MEYVSRHDRYISTLFFDSSTSFNSVKLKSCEVLPLGDASPIKFSIFRDNRSCLVCVNESTGLAY